jgi:hypothetical protein
MPLRLRLHHHHCRVLLLPHLPQCLRLHRCCTTDISSCHCACVCTTTTAVFCYFPIFLSVCGCTAAAPPTSLHAQLQFQFCCNSDAILLQGSVEDDGSSRAGGRHGRVLQHRSSGGVFVPARRYQEGPRLLVWQRLSESKLVCNTCASERTCADAHTLTHSLTPTHVRTHPHTDWRAYSTPLQCPLYANCD